MTKRQLTRVCASCGATFRKTHSHQKYCGMPCAVWPRIEKHGADECWPWQGAKNDRGYGQFRMNGVLFYAHREVAKLSGAIYQDGDDTLHSCDNPPCCNPAHLSPGTTQQNLSDMHARGRWSIPHPHVGEAHVRAKIKEADALAIRRRNQSGESQRSLAKEYGICQAQVWRICSGASWSHL